MTAGMSMYSDVSSLANPIQESAYFVIRELYQMQNLVTVFRDMSGLNPRKGYVYNSLTANEMTEGDEIVEQKFTPSLLTTLTPTRKGVGFFVTDERAESDLPENIIRDGGMELGNAIGTKVETDLVTAMASLTGGTIGAAGTAITWGYVSAAIAVARNANKSMGVPLACVMHGYQWAVLAKSASIAGATVAAVAPTYQDEITRMGKVAEFMGVPIYQVFTAADTNSDFTGGVFPRSAIAIDWRRAVRVEPEREPKRSGTGFYVNPVWASGVWRASLGVKMVFDATAPSS